MSDNLKSKSKSASGTSASGKRKRIAYKSVVGEVCLTQSKLSTLEALTKPKKRKRDYEPLSMQDALRNIPSTENNKILQTNIAIMLLPDIDLHDEAAVRSRLTEFFEIYASADLKPTVAGLALCLNGHKREWLYAIMNGGIQGKTSGGDVVKLPSSVLSLIKKAYGTMENMWESYMSAGKINPVTGIFVAKNHYNYVDKQEHIVTPNVGNDSDLSVEDIKSRYMLEDNIVESSVTSDENAH